MKPFCFSQKNRSTRGGFSLVEATLSLGVVSFGLLSFIPFLGLGSRLARLAQDDRASAEIAQTLTEEAQQGALTSGTTYFDTQGTVCASTQAAFMAQSTLAAVAGNPYLSALVLRITPLGAPDRARTYALIFAPSS